MKTAMPRCLKGQVSTLLLTTLAVLLLALTRAVYLDPYWIFRTSPPWVESEGAGRNTIIDLQMRRAKLLQLLTFNIDRVIIGSSVVYRGIDPQPTSGLLTYNAGISSLMSRELPIVAAISGDKGSLREVVFGLDYYMFSDLSIPAQIDASLTTIEGRFKLLVGSVISLDNLAQNTFKAVAARSEPGRWKSNGFRESPDRNAAQTIAIHKDQRDNMRRYVRERREDLVLALKIVSAKMTTVYLSPMSKAQRQLTREQGMEQDLAVWRADMQSVARSAGVRFFDLTDLETEDRYDPATGSSSTWLDNLHFQPVIGERILQIIAAPKIAMQGARSHARGF